MALPTYKKQAQQVAAPQQVRSGDMASESLMASAQVSNTLAQRLQSFSQSLGGLAKSAAVGEASKAAVRDIYNRKQKIAEINADPNLTEEEKQEQRDEVTEGTDRVFSGVYSRAYESAAASAYSNQIRTDAKAAQELAIEQSEGDPEAFMKAYSEFGKETVKGAPTEATAILAEQTITGYGASAYKNLKLAQMRKNSAKNASRYKDSMEAYQKQLSDAYYAEDDVEISRIETLVDAANKAALRDGYISLPEYENVSMVMRNNAIIDVVNRKFNDALNVGNGNDAYIDFMALEGEGYFDTIPPEDISKIKSSMRKQIKEFNDARLEQRKFDIEMAESVFEETYLDGMKQAADGTLNEATIVDWEKKGLIDTSRADNLRDRVAVGETRKVSDAKALSGYAETTTLIETSAEAILNDPMLSESDKTNLVIKRERALTTKFKWRTSDDGIEASRRIKSAFGILEGTLMAQIDLENNTMRDFDRVYKAFYDEVSRSESPTDEVLGIANRLLREYNDTKEAEKQEKARIRKEREMEEAKNAAAAANDSIMVKIGWRDPVTPEQMMLEK